MRTGLYQGVIFVAALIVEAVLICVSVIGYDFHNRHYPAELGATSSFTIDFAPAGLRDDGARELLRQASDESGAALVKELPDESAPTDKLYVPVGTSVVPKVLRGFGYGTSGSLGEHSRLELSPANGTYLVTGTIPSADALERQLLDAGASVVRVDADPIPGIGFLITGGTLLIPILVLMLLLLAMSVMWIAVSARSRMLRLLAGASVYSIQATDFTRYFTAVVGGVAVASSAAVAVVAITVVEHTLAYAILLCTLSGFALLFAAASYVLVASVFKPDVDSFALRIPPVGKLRSGARAVQAIGFGLAVTIAGSAWHQVSTSSIEAERLAVWNELANTTAIEFAMDEAEMLSVAGPSRDAAMHAEAREALLYSSSTSAEEWDGDFGEYESIAFVNQVWLDRAGFRGQSLHPVALDDVKGMMEREWVPTLDLWSAGTGTTGSTLLERSSFFEIDDGSPLAVQRGSSGHTVDFLDRSLIVVVPSVGESFNEDTVVSFLSTANLTFSDMESANNALSEAGLSSAALADERFDGRVALVFVTEQGVLAAQLAQYTAALSVVAFAVVLATFVISSVANGVISALLNANRDGPLRLSGYSWFFIVRGRVVNDCLLGFAFAVVFCLLDSSRVIAVSAFFVPVGVICILLSQAGAASRSFGLLLSRRL